MTQKRRERAWEGVVRRVGLALVCGLWVACHTTVQHGLAEDQANQIVAALQRSGLEARKVKEEGRGNTYAVQVARGEESRAIALLRHYELPRRSPPGFAEVYGKRSLVPTADEQQARYLHALSGELERTLETLPGVRQARVHLVIPRRDPLAVRSERTAPRAAVLLRVAADAPPVSEDAVRRLVAGSVARLAPESVAVVIQQSRPLPKADLGPALAHVGPVAVSRDSRALLLGILVGSAVVVLGLTLALLLLLLKLRSLQAELVAVRAEPAAAEPETGALPE